MKVKEKWKMKKNWIYAFNRGNQKNTMRKYQERGWVKNKGKRGEMKNEKKKRKIYVPKIQRNWSWRAKVKENEKESESENYKSQDPELLVWCWTKVWYWKPQGRTVETIMKKKVRGCRGWPDVSWLSGSFSLDAYKESGSWPLENKTRAWKPAG